MKHDLKPHFRAQRQGDFTNNSIKRLKPPSLKLIAWVVHTFPFCCHVDSTLLRGWSYELGMKWGIMTLQIVHQMFVMIVLLRKRRCVGKQFLKHTTTTNSWNVVTFLNLCCPLHLYGKMSFYEAIPQRKYTWLQNSLNKEFSFLEMPKSHLVALHMNGMRTWKALNMQKNG
jgi:hypothetical protein